MKMHTAAKAATNRVERVLEYIVMDEQNHDFHG
jgi:hypothetical protein